MPEEGTITTEASTTTSAQITVAQTTETNVLITGTRGYGKIMCSSY